MNERYQNGSTEFGDRLKKERKRFGLSINGLAKLAKLDAHLITGYENRGQAPTVKSLIKIAEALDCTTDWLLGLQN